MKNVKLVVFDVDGTLTSGVVHLDDEGREHKHFSIADGLGFRLAEEAGLMIAVITGRDSQAVRFRMNRLPPEHVMIGIENKRKAMSLLQNMHHLQADEIAYAGDDLNDLPAFLVAGVKIAVANAAPEVKYAADYVTVRKGGDGAARETIEVILRAQDRYESTVQQYLESISQ